MHRNVLVLQHMTCDPSVLQVGTHSIGWWRVCVCVSIKWMDTHVLQKTKFNSQFQIIPAIYLEYNLNARRYQTLTGQTADIHKF